MFFKRMLFFFAVLLASNSLYADTNSEGKTSMVNNGKEAWPWLKNVDQPQVKDKLYFKFLGTGGIFLSYNNQAILGDPFFTNTPLADLVLLKDLKPNVPVIEKFSPKSENIKAILVGHGHYDHLMDIPIVHRLIKQKIKILGSTTAINQIASQIEAEQLLDITDKTVGFKTDEKPDWIYLSEKLRVAPLKADHPPHFAGMLFASDRVLQPQQELPGSVLSWQCGEPLGYLIEWLENERAVFRVLYLSSGAGFPKGMPPEAYIKENAPIDLALLAIANYRSVDHYPGRLLEHLKPKNVVMIHWEKFWQPYEPGKAEPLKDEQVAAFIRDVRKAAPQSRLYLPRRQAALTIPVEENNER